MKFAGAYHGHVDGLLAEAGSGWPRRGCRRAPGDRGAGLDTVIVLERGRGRRCDRQPRARGGDLRADPGQHGSRPSGSGFLEHVRDAAAEAGSLLILDEVISGFRVARGGAQELLGIDADLTVMGKVLGGGLPAAAYGGRAS